MDESVRRENKLGSFREELERLETSGFKLEPVNEEFMKATAEAAREVLNEKKDEQEDLWWNKFWSWFESFVERFFNWRG
jgi:TRAP-type mannitol/chloroaromatic compound transport system substrate-binding protein